MKLLLAVSFLTALGSLPVRASDGSVIATLTGMDGSNPEGPLVADSVGRLYGSALTGGQFGMGSIFRLTPPPAGSSIWTKEILHAFSGLDGSGPEGGLLLDSSGNIYGTTFAGGSAEAGGYGVVFRLSNAPGWPATVLHSFTGKETDAIEPNGGLVFGPGGLIYGTTYYSALFGGSEMGAVFSISPLGDATEYAIIYKFASGRALEDGVSPTIGLVPGGPSKFYGATFSGGHYNLGVIYSLTLQSDGTWRERVVHHFTSGGDIYDLQTQGSLVRGPDGSLYACGAMGGAHGLGGVISLTFPGIGYGQMTETMLDNFGSNSSDPADACALTVQPSGSLIATSIAGGRFNQGSLFQLTPPAMPGGFWSSNVLHSFGLSGPAEAYPYGALLPQGSTYFGVNSIGPGTGIQTGSGAIFSFRP